MTKIHKIVLLVVDHDDLGADELTNVLENVSYPNHCMYLKVMETETREVEWSDDHSLNVLTDQRDEFARLFY